MFNPILQNSAYIQEPKQKGKQCFYPVQQSDEYTSNFQSKAKVQIQRPYTERDVFDQSKKRIEEPRKQEPDMFQKKVRIQPINEKKESKMFQEKIHTQGPPIGVEKKLMQQKIRAPCPETKHFVQVNQKSYHIPKKTQEVQFKQQKQFGDYSIHNQDPNTFNPHTHDQLNQTIQYTNNINQNTHTIIENMQKQQKFKELEEKI